MAMIKGFIFGSFLIWQSYLPGYTSWEGDLPFLWWSALSWPYSMYLPAQGYEGILPLSDACIFVKEIAASCKGKILQRVEHHSWGGPFVAEKMCFFSARSKKKSVHLGPCEFLIFVTKHLMNNFPIHFPNLVLFSAHNRAFLNTSWEGDLPFLWWSALSWHLPAQGYEGIFPLSDACIFVKESAQDLAAGRTPFVGGTLCGRKHVLF